MQKLLEYKMYKFMSLELKDRQVDAARNLYRDVPSFLMQLQD